MNTPTRTIQRRTSLPYRGRQIVLIIPPACDYISLRHKGTRRTYDIALASIYDLAVRQHVARIKAEKKAKRGGK